MPTLSRASAVGRLSAGGARWSHLQRQLSGPRVGVGQTSSVVETEHGHEHADDEERNRDDEKNAPEGRHLGHSQSINQSINQ